jgi:thymidylate synthase (FAD)
MQVKMIAITQYFNDSGSPEALIEHAGRVCYRSQSRGNPSAFIKARLRDGHESIVEHASATFDISGISRACSHQLVRHRLASYSQESQRYVDMSDPDIVIPPTVSEKSETMAIWDDLLESVKAAYTALRQAGVRKEDARFVLPNASATRIIVTMNFREYLHFFHLRITPEAQWEIRLMAIMMLKALVPYAPSVFSDLWDGVQNSHPEWISEI